jgi:hypothetical protein
MGEVDKGSGESGDCRACRARIDASVDSRWLHSCRTLLWKHFAIEIENPSCAGYSLLLLVILLMVDSLEVVAEAMPVSSALSAAAAALGPNCV